MKNMMSPRTFAWFGCWWLGCWWIGCWWIATAGSGASLWGQESHDFQQQFQLLEQKLTKQFETQFKKFEDDQQSVHQQLDAWKNKLKTELEVWTRDSNQKLATWTETHGTEMQQYLHSNSSNINRWIANAEQEIARTVRQLEKKIDQALKPQSAPRWEPHDGAEDQINPLTQRVKSNDSSSHQRQKILSSIEAEASTEVRIRNAILEELARHRAAMATLQSQLKLAVQARAAAQQNQSLKEHVPKAPSAAGFAHSDPSPKPFPKPGRIIQPVQATEQQLKPSEIELLRNEIKQLREELDKLK